MKVGQGGLTKETSATWGDKGGEGKKGGRNNLKIVVGEGEGRKGP